MTSPRTDWTPQDVLWDLGASFVDATADTAEATVQAAVSRIGPLLGCTTAGVWRIDGSTGEAKAVQTWALNDDYVFEKGSPVRTDSGVGEAVIAGGGFAVVDIEMIAGAETCAKRGWTGGTAVVAVVHVAEAEVVVLVVTSTANKWDAAERELIRGCVLLLRQFNRRIEAEASLQKRQRLSDFTVSLAARFQAVSPESLHSEIDRALTQFRDVIEAESVVVIDVVDEHTVVIAHLSAEVSLPDGQTTVQVPDISKLPGCAGMTLREFVSQPRVMDVAELVDALMGPEVSDSLGLRNPPRTVALLPTSVADGHSLLAVSRFADGDSVWQSEEFDALSTMASLVAQTRGRVAAEVASRGLLEAQRELAAVGKLFLDASPETIGSAVGETLQRIGTHLGADLALVASIGSDHETVTITDSWSGHDELIVPAGTILNRNAFPIIDDMLVAETTTILRKSSVEDARPLSESADGRWAGVVAPIQGSGLTPTGLAFIFSDSSKSDSAAVRDLANATADLIGQLKVRIRAEEAVTARLHADSVLAELADRFMGMTLENVQDRLVEALDRCGTSLNLRGIAVRRVSASGVSEIEIAWAPAGKMRPAAGDSVELPRGIDRREIAAVRSAEEALWSARSVSDWGPGVSLTVVPVLSTSRDESSLVFATTTSFADHELEAFRALAGTLGQLRARLAEEWRADRRLGAQRLLGLCARELAEASPDDFVDRLTRVLERVARFAGLGGLVYVQLDHLNERYFRLASWLDDEFDIRPDALDSAAFGTRALLDTVRTSLMTSEAVVDSPTLSNPSRIAVPAGDGTRVERVLLGASDQTERFSAEVHEMLESLSTTMREVSARVAAQRYANAAFEGAPIGVVLRDERLNLITCNQAFVDFVGASSPDELVGTPPDHVYDVEFETVEWSTEPNGQLTGEAPFRGPDGGRVWGQMRAAVVPGGSGEHFWLIHIEDVTERRRTEQLLRFQASHDELTGLANRRRLLEEMHRVADGSGSVGVLLLDLDRFKNVNDSLGHDRGDELLVVIADRLRLAVRPGDLVARLGGDEFAIILPGPVSVPDAEFVAERLLSLIGEPVLLGRQSIYPTASIGIAVADDSSEVDDLLRRADTAMYRAKAQGRARSESFDEKLREAVHSRMATEAGLRGALRNDEFVVHYQPEVSLEDGRMVGAEALIRWNHPEKGVLPAAEFIEIAEETGLVVEMGAIVLAKACAEAASWPGGDDGPVIGVNLAAAQLQRDDTVTLVRSVLAETGLAPHRLCLEITESAVMSDIHRSEEILQRLKALGVHLSVDDFGTGFSSLAYLKRFPVDALKIDRAFVCDLSHDSEDVAFVRSIVSLANALGLDVVAEGVETLEQAQVLLELGCLRAQGYFFARPGPAESLQHHLVQLTL